MCMECGDFKTKIVFFLLNVYLQDVPYVKLRYIWKKDVSNAKFIASAQLTPQLNPLWRFPGKVIMNSPAL